MIAEHHRRGELFRRSAAILNGDIAGFSRLVADDVAATVDDVDRARRLTKQTVDEMAGRLVDFIGDNFMAVFPPRPARWTRRSRSAPGSIGSMPACLLAGT